MPAGGLAPVLTIETCHYANRVYLSIIRNVIFTRLPQTSPLVTLEILTTRGVCSFLKLVRRQLRLVVGLIKQILKILSISLRYLSLLLRVSKFLCY